MLNWIQREDLHKPTSHLQELGTLCIKTCATCVSNQILPIYSMLHLIVLLKIKTSIRISLCFRQKAVLCWCLLTHNSTKKKAFKRGSSYWFFESWGGYETVLFWFHEPEENESDIVSIVYKKLE